MLIALCAYASVSIAQPKTPPAWSAKFKSPVNWQRIHSLGYLIVGTNDGIYGVNPADGKIIWENKNYPAILSENFSEKAFLRGLICLEEIIVGPQLFA